MILVPNTSEKLSLGLSIDTMSVLIQTSMSDDAVRCYVVLKATKRSDCYSFKLNNNSRLLDMLRLKRSFLVSVLFGTELFQAMLKLSANDIELEFLGHLKQEVPSSEQCCPHT